MVMRGKPGAVAVAQKASDLAPENASVLDTLATALAAEKQLDRAVTTQKRAVELAPEANGLRLHLAELAAKAGDKTLARTELTRLQGLGARFNQQEEVSRLLKTL
jgi:cellulose synthase operon protein C